MAEGSSRRRFIQHVAWSSLGGYLVLSSSACKSRRAPTPTDEKQRRAALFRGGHFLSDGEFATLGALCELVLPRDEDPGASDLGVPEYIDRAIQEPDHKTRLAVMRKGLFTINQRHQEARGKPLFAASPEAQAEFFRGWTSENAKNAEFLQILVGLTLEGAFGDPSYGGNKGEAGWRMLGYKPDPCRPSRAALPIHKG
jgi:gluconate 2-dehydrogenase gamma chain